MHKKDISIYLSKRYSFRAFTISLRLLTIVYGSILRHRRLSETNRTQKITVNSCKFLY